MFTETGLRLRVGLRALYTHDSYPVDRLGRYFDGLSSSWEACLDVAKVAWLIENPPEKDFRILNITDPGSARPASRPSPLQIERLSIGSPMDVTLLLQGGGASALTIYSLHLMVKVVRDPRRLGAWVPRLLSGWHQGMREVHVAKDKRGKLERASRTTTDALIKTGHQIELIPDSVEPFGIGEEPEDIRLSA
jgi:hypothetical protein